MKTLEQWVGLAALCALVGCVEGSGANDPARSSAALHTTITQEITLGAGYTGSSGLGPSIACTGTTCLVAWKEPLPFNGIGEPPASPVYAARIRVDDGAVLDLSPMPIGTGYGTVRVAAAADQFLVTWKDVGLYGARVRASDGAILDGDRIEICERDRSLHSVASNGESFLVVQQVEGIPDCQYFPASICTKRYDIHATAVAADGSVDDVCGSALTSDLDSDENPRVAWAGTDYLVAWGGGDNPDARFVSAEGVPRETVELDLGGDGPIGLAADADGRFMALWLEGDLTAQRLDADGEPMGAALAVGGAETILTLHDGLVFDGTSYVALWWEDSTDGADAFTARIATDGTEVSSPFVIGGGDSLATSGNGRSFVASGQTPADVATGEPRFVIVQVLESDEEVEGPGAGGGAGGGSGGSSGGCSGNTLPPATCSTGLSGAMPGLPYGWMLLLGVWIAHRRTRRRRPGQVDALDSSDRL